MKKILAIVLVMCLLCITAIGTTLSYFTDTDMDKNTMVVGNVKIEQVEQKRDENGNLVNLVADNNNVTSLGKLYPYIGTVTTTDGWFDTAKNAVDKIVTVKNIGSEAAYIRTLFAFEAVGGADPIDSATKKIHVNYSDASVGEWKYMGSFEIENDTTYFVYSFTYKDIVAGKTNTTTVETAPSLKQIALDCSVGNEFAGQIEGSYDILVVSQAVQAIGFENAATAFVEAFGALNAEWFTPPTTP